MIENPICQCGYRRDDHIIRKSTYEGNVYYNKLCPYSLYLGHNSWLRTMGGVFTYSVGFNND